MDVVLAASPDEVLVDLGNHDRGIAAIGGGEEYPGTEATETVDIGRGHRHQKHIWVLHKTSGQVSIAPHRRGEIAHASVVDHVSIERSGVEIVQLENILVSVTHPREERRGVVNPDAFKLTPTFVEGFAQGIGRAIDDADHHLVARFHH